MKTKEEIAKLANEAVEFLDWSYMNAAFDSENGLHKWQTMDKRNLTTTELYEIFKTRNKK